jgi:uncharacterized protein (TIGR02118 family)
MAKIIFVLHRRSDLNLEEIRRHWSGEAHLALVRRLPGLRRFVQNYVVGPPEAPVCDGVGELWFESQAKMEAALSSPELGAAVESAKRFLDMDKTGLIIVDEKTIIG